MPSVPISERTELSQELAAVLSPQHELFAVYVASGLGYRESARRAGFHEDNGFRLMQMPRLRVRIEELVSEPAERIRAGIDAEFLMLRNRAANEDLDAEGRANVELRLKLVMAHARYRGWLVDRKQVSQVSARVSVPRGDLEAAIRADIERLVPGAMKHVEAGVLGEDQIRAIAAGEVVVEPPS
jgi:hypothetical protein